MRNIPLILVVLFACVIFVSFFLPWFNINSPVTGTIFKMFNVKQDTSFMEVSGFQVPILANRSDSQFMVQVLQLFNPGVKDVDKKSWLIWGVPLLAVLLACACVFLKENRWFNLALGIIGVLIFAVGAYKLKTTNLDKTVMRVSIMPGLWLLLYGYLGMGLVGLFKSIKPGQLKGR
ncbi:MAG: hypothetical protein PHO03_01640 [Candidatus Omnitrophica bacterium]|nr:hypothetical protein [Candidatus Omnitrophota bacterium]